MNIRDSLKMSAGVKKTQDFINEDVIDVEKARSRIKSTIYNTTNMILNDIEVIKRIVSVREESQESRLVPGIGYSMYSNYSPSKEESIILKRTAYKTFKERLTSIEAIIEKEFGRENSKEEE